MPGRKTGSRTRECIEINGLEDAVKLAVCLFVKPDQGRALGARRSALGLEGAAIGSGRVARVG
jgi:hypothetical protein